MYLLIIKTAANNTQDGSSFNLPSHQDPKKLDHQGVDNKMVQLNQGQNVMNPNTVVMCETINGQNNQLIRGLTLFICFYKLMGLKVNYSTIGYIQRLFVMIAEKKLRKPIIRNYIFQEFNRASTSKEFQSLYRQKLSLFVLEKEDKNLMYVTDGCNTILAISIRKKKQEVPFLPYWPRGQRPLFYKANIKTYRYLNFTKDYPLLPEWTQATDLDQPTYQYGQDKEGQYQQSFKDKHPYNPYSFFDEKSFKIFLDQRSSYKCPATIIHFTKWQLGLVNINETGYYAPVIVFHEFVNGNERCVPPDYLSLNCILFEQNIQEKLQQYRVNDIRERYNRQKVQKPIKSLFYKARHLTLNTGTTLNSLKVQIDCNQAIFKYSKDKQINYILTSDCLEGVCSVTNTQSQGISIQVAKEIQTKDISILFNGLDLQPTKKVKLEEMSRPIERVRVKKAQYQQLWQDSDQEEEEYEPKINRMMAEYSESSSEEEQDLLATLYKKSLASRK